MSFKMNGGVNLDRKITEEKVKELTHFFNEVMLFAGAKITELRMLPVIAEPKKEEPKNGK